MLGALVADALSMPVHWYYDTDALDRDYPNLDTYQFPKNPHPDSILWRSKYIPRSKDANILHDQAQYWGMRGIHYHQFLQAGDNTINFTLGMRLYELIVTHRRYDLDAWLDVYIYSMRTPNWHCDTYLEEYHRKFFDRLANGTSPKKCGVEDIHIGGLTPIPFIMAGLYELNDRTIENVEYFVKAHLELTHKGCAIAAAAEVFVQILQSLLAGIPLRESIEINAFNYVSSKEMNLWIQAEDRLIVGRHLSSACYLPDSFRASLYLAWKYHDDFTSGITANARCGGDNSHRGAIIGSLLGAANQIPKYWLQALKIKGLSQIYK